MRHRAKEKEGFNVWKGVWRKEEKNTKREREKGSRERRAMRAVFCLRVV